MKLVPLVTAGTAFLLLSFSGCQKPVTKLVKVEGVVTLEGKPLPNLYVQFLPDAFRGTVGPRSSATSDAAGHFVLMCDTNQEGAVAGTHRVVIEDPEKKPGQQGDSAPPPAGRIHLDYQSAGRTPLLVEVPSGGGIVDLKLVAQPKPGVTPKRES